MSNEPCTDAHLDRDGRLASRCWCEAMEVRVTPADVRNGLTASCGPDCHPTPGRPPRATRTRWAILDTPRKKTL